MEGLELQYFTGPHCGVCKALKPKLKAFLKEEFPSLQLNEVDISEDREIAAQNMVFALPVLLIKVDDREYERFVRAFSVGEVRQKLTRIVESLRA